MRMSIDSEALSEGRASTYMPGPSRHPLNKAFILRKNEDEDEDEDGDGDEWMTELMNE